MGRTIKKVDTIRHISAQTGDNQYTILPVVNSTSVSYMDVHMIPNFTKTVKHLPRKILTKNSI